MPSINFYSDHKLLARVRLDDQSILIGRSSECDIQLPSVWVSRHHARIDRGRDELYTIENLGANGTRLNAAQLSSRTDLHPGDRIYIEKYVLIYQPDAEARAPSDEELTELVACSASALPARRPLVDRPDAEVLSE